MKCHAQRVEDEVCAHVDGELPADDHPAVGVEDEGEEDESFPAAQVGAVSDPELVRAAGGEVALDEVRPPLRLRVGPGGAPRLAAPLRTDDPVALHQPLHPAARDLARRRDGAPSTSAGSHRRSSWPHAARGSGRAAARPRPLERGGERCVVGSRRTPTRPASCRSARPRSGHDARRRSGSPRSAGSSSLAKNTLADFRISFARRSSKFSCRSRLISSRSSLVGRSGLRPCSASA